MINTFLQLFIFSIFFHLCHFFLLKPLASLWFAYKLLTLKINFLFLNVIGLIFTGKDLSELQNTLTGFLLTDRFINKIILYFWSVFCF